MCFTIGLENKVFHVYPPSKVVNELEESDVVLSSYYTRNNENIFLKTFFEDTQSKDSTCYILAKYIMVNYVKSYIEKIIDEIYCYFNKEEKEEIFNAFIKEKEVLYLAHLIKEYLKENNYLILSGFVNFRLMDYFDRVSGYVEILVDDLLMKKEYYEFIRLLKCFVGLQESKYEEVHVIKDKEKGYVLTDEKGILIPKSCEKDFLCEVSDEFGEYDLLLSELISVSPKKIVVHDKSSFGDSDILKTIEMIFENSVVYYDDNINEISNNMEINDCVCSDIKIDPNN